MLDENMCYDISKNSSLYYTMTDTEEKQSGLHRKMFSSLSPSYIIELKQIGG